MIYLLFFLIPIVLLLAWGVIVDQQRRRRGNIGIDVKLAARTVRLDAERRTTKWGAGLYPACAVNQPGAKLIAASTERALHSSEYSNPGARFRSCATVDRQNSLGRRRRAWAGPMFCIQADNLVRRRTSVSGHLSSGPRCRIKPY